MAVNSQHGSEKNNVASKATNHQKFRPFSIYRLVYVLAYFAGREVSSIFAREKERLLTRSRVK